MMGQWARYGNIVVFVLLLAFSRAKAAESRSQEAAQLLSFSITCVNAFKDWFGSNACAFSGVTCTNGAVTDLVVNKADLTGCRVPLSWISG